MGESEDRRWKVGELARATGLTVRTLHHYDDVGLLVPWERTFAGHRLYAEHDVRRLYRILALRRLGIGLDEIASLLDDGRVSLLETVRRHLEQVERELEHRHGLRRHLRQILDALERSVEPAVDEFIDAMEAMMVIETSVEDVVIRLPADEAGEPPGRLARESQRVVLLRERGGERVLPIWIGAEAGDALVHHRENPEGLRRPLGPDLTAKLLEAGDVRVERVVIESLHENTYYATVTVTARGESQEVDARPSDALNLAVRLGAPVFVAGEVIDQAGVRSDGGLGSRLSQADASARGTQTPGEWRSLSTDLMRSLYPRGTASFFERLSEQARHVVTFAQEEARAFRHDHIGPEHILLGLAREEPGIAADVLEALGITAERVRGQLVHIAGLDEEVTSGQIPFKPSVEKVFERALREAVSLGPDDVGTEHILLALVREDEDALIDFGVGADRVREQVHRAVAGSPPNESPAGGSLPDPS